MAEHETRYVLGHSPHELQRLGHQARLIDSSTRTFFLEAGLAPGMRVLDVGSGAGNTAFLAASIVGATGEVVGTDRSIAAVSAAQKNAAEQSIAHVAFRHCDAADLDPEDLFDAVIGRYVLIFNADQVGLLRQLARNLKPCGLLVFHEPSLSLARSIPSVALYDKCCQWALDAFVAGGTRADTVYTLHRTFIDAGLPPPTMRMHAPFGGASGIFDWIHVLVDMLRTLLPAMEQHGIASAAEVGIDDLADRLCAEIAASGSTVIGRIDVGAWVRLPPI